MDNAAVTSALCSVFSRLQFDYEQVRYSLEGDDKFKPPVTVVRKVLTDYAKQAAMTIHAGRIVAAFDENPDFTIALALAAAASYAGPDAFNKSQPAEPAPVVAASPPLKVRRTKKAEASMSDV
jgi:hypothetical protein